MSKQEFCVIFKLTKDEQAAFEKFSRDNEVTDNMAIPLLVKNYLIENDEAHKEEINHSLYEERLKKLEEFCTKYELRSVNNLRRNDDLERQIAGLRTDLNDLKRYLKEKAIDRITDDEIAAITGRRVQEVWEWRHGIRKPRGTRTLEKLAPYEVKDGVWIKK